MSRFVTNLILGKIKNGIENQAMLNGIGKNDLYIKIFPIDEDFTPEFELCNHVDTIKPTSFGEIIGMDNILGVDVGQEGSEWLQRFMGRCAIDNSLDFYDNPHFYFIRINKNDDLQVYLYVNDQPYMEIELDYITKT